MLGTTNFRAYVAGMPAWSDYQEEVAAYFRDLGLNAETNVRLRGVRTVHDVDVVVRSDHVGFDMLWIVECKRYKGRVSKLHVLALREIVADLGADRGLLMAENGFQRGAKEAAQLTNVQLSSMSALRESSQQALGFAKLRSLQDRIDSCWERYWSLDKSVRIRHGLRPEVGAPHGYRGRAVIQASSAALNDAFRSGFPVAFDLHEAQWGGIGQKLPIAAGAPWFNTPNELHDHLSALMTDLESRLDAAEASEAAANDANLDPRD
jgi:restriction system protein